MFTGKRDEFDPLRPRLNGRDMGVPSSGPSDDDLFDMSGAIPDDLVDAMLDGEVPSKKIAEIRGLIRTDAQAERRLNKTNEILDLLKHTKTAAQAPDLTGAIMARVERERSLMSWRGLRRVVSVRYAAAAVLAMMIGGAFMAQRQSPQSFTLVSRPAPINDLVSAVPQQTAGVLATVEGAMNAAGSLVPAQFEQVRLRDAVALAQRVREGGSEVIPAMNPAASAVLWLEPSVGGSGRELARLCNRPPCQSRRLAVPAQQLSLRSILAGEDRPATSDDTIVAFRR